MGANRKLQIEIDRTLKKVSEGIDIFDEIWEKVRILRTVKRSIQEEPFATDHSVHWHEAL